MSGDPLSRCNCPLGHLWKATQSKLYDGIGYMRNSKQFSKRLTMSGTKSAPWVGRLAHRVHPDGFALVGLVVVVVAAAAVG